MEERPRRFAWARLALDIAREKECRYEWTDANWATEETLKEIEKLYCFVCKTNNWIFDLWIVICF